MDARTFTTSSASVLCNSKFSGFKSLCTMPCRWRKRTALARRKVMTAAFASGYGPLAAMRPYSSPPSISSITISTCVLDSNASMRDTTYSCWPTWRRISICATDARKMACQTPARIARAGLRQRTSS